VSILDTGTAEQLRERALHALDHAGVLRRMAARLVRNAERSEAEARHWVQLADEREKEAGQG
jgi:hypothetical protein